MAVLQKEQLFNYFWLFDISKIKCDMQALEDDFLDQNEVPKKLIELEDRSRRNNLCFDGLTDGGP